MADDNENNYDISIRASDEGVRSAADSVQKLTENVGQLADTVRSASNDLNAHARAMGAQDATMRSAKTSATEYVRLLDGMKAGSEQYTKTVQDMNAANMILVGTEQRFVGVMDMSTGKIVQSNQETERLAKSAAASAVAIKQMTDEESRAAQEHQMAAQNAQRYGETLRAISKLENMSADERKANMEAYQNLSLKEQMDESKLAEAHLKTLEAQKKHTEGGKELSKVQKDMIAASEKNVDSFYKQIRPAQELSLKFNDLKKAGVDNSLVAKVYANDIINAVDTHKKFGQEIPKNVAALESEARAFAGGGKSVDLFGGSMKEIGGIAKGLFAVFAGATIVETIAKWTEEVLKFQEEWARTEILMAKGSNTEAMKKGLLDFKGELGSTKELVGGLQTLLKSGIGGEEALKMLENGSKLASVTGDSIESAVGLMRTTMKSFGIDMKETEKTADELWKILARGGDISASTLQYGLAMVGPTAKGLGIELKDLGKVISALGSSGMSGSRAMFALQGIISQMADPSSQLVKQMRLLGVNITEQMVKDEGFISVLGRVAEKIGGSAKMAKELGFEQRQLAIIMNLANGAAEKQTDDLLDLEDAHKKTEDTISAKWSALQNSFSRWIVKTAEDCKTLKTILDDLKGMFDGTGKGIHEATVFLGLFIAALGTGALIKFVPWMMEAVKAGGLLGGTLGTVGQAVAVVGVAIAGWKIGRWIADITGADKALEGLWTKLKLFDHSEEDNKMYMAARRKLAESLETRARQLNVGQKEMEQANIDIVKRGFNDFYDPEPYIKRMTALIQEAEKAQGVVKKVGEEVKKAAAPSKKEALPPLNAIEVGEFSKEFGLGKTSAEIRVLREDFNTLATRGGLSADKIAIAFANMTKQIIDNGGQLSKSEEARLAKSVSTNDAYVRDKTLPIWIDYLKKVEDAHGNLPDFVERDLLKMASKGDAALRGKMLPIWKEYVLSAERSTGELPARMMDQIKEFMGSDNRDVREAAVGLWTEVVKDSVDAFGNIKPEMLKIIYEMMDSQNEAYQKLGIEGIKTYIDAATKAGARLPDEMLPRIMELMGSTNRAYREVGMKGFKSYIDGVATEAGRLPDSVLPVIDELLNKTDTQLVKTGLETWRTYINGAVSQHANLDAALPMIKKFLGSTDKAWLEAGRQGMQAYWESLKDASGSISTQVPELIGEWVFSGNRILQEEGLKGWEWYKQNAIAQVGRIPDEAIPFIEQLMNSTNTILAQKGIKDWQQYVDDSLTVLGTLPEEAVRITAEKMLSGNRAMQNKMKGSWDSIVAASRDSYGNLPPEIWKINKEIERQMDQSSGRIQKEWEDAFGQLAPELASAFSDVIFEGKKMSDALTDVFKNMGKRILDTFLKELFKPLQTGLEQLGATVARGLTTGNWGGGNSGSTAGAQQGGYGNMLSGTGSILSGLTSQGNSASKAGGIGSASGAYNSSKMSFLQNLKGSLFGDSDAAQTMDFSEFFGGGKGGFFGSEGQGGFLGSGTGGINGKGVGGALGGIMTGVGMSLAMSGISNWKSNSAGDWLKSIGGGAMTGFAMAGPLGAGIGAAIGGIAKGIGALVSWAKGKTNAEAGTDEIKRDYGGVKMDQDTYSQLTASFGFDPNGGDLWRARGDVAASPAMMQQMFALAQQQGKTKQYMSALDKNYGGGYEFDKNLQIGVLTGDYTKLNETWKTTVYYQDLVKRGLKTQADAMMVGGDIVLQSAQNFETYYQEMLKTGDVTEEFTKYVKDNKAKLIEAGETYSIVAEDLKKMDEVMARLEEHAAEFAALDNLKKGLTAIKDGLLNMEPAIKDSTSLFIEDGVVTEDFRKKVAALGGDVAAFETTAGIVKINKYFSDLVGTFRETGEILPDLSKIMKEYGADMAEVGKADMLPGMKKAIADLSSFKQGVMDLLPETTGLQDVLSGIWSDETIKKLQLQGLDASSFENVTKIIHGMTGWKDAVADFMNTGKLTEGGVPEIARQVMEKAGLSSEQLANVETLFKGQKNKLTDSGKLISEMLSQFGGVEGQQAVDLLNSGYSTITTGLLDKTKTAMDAAYAAERDKVLKYIDDAQSQISDRASVIEASIEEQFQIVNNNISNAFASAREKALDELDKIIAKLDEVKKAALLTGDAIPTDLTSGNGTDISTTTGGSELEIPGAAIGAKVLKTGLLLVHGGEEVTPAKVSREGGSGKRVIHYHNYAFNAPIYGINDLKSQLAAMWAESAKDGDFRGMGDHLN